MFLVLTLLRRVLDMPPRDDGKLLLPGSTCFFRQARYCMRKNAMH